MQSKRKKKRQTGVSTAIKVAVIGFLAAVVSVLITECGSNHRAAMLPPDKLPDVCIVDAPSVDFRVPTIAELKSHVYLAITNDPRGAQEVVDAINRLSPAVQEGVCQSFRATVWRFDVKNVGQSMAKNIRTEWFGCSFSTLPSLAPGEMAGMDKWIHMQICFSSRNKQTGECIGVSIKWLNSKSAWMGIIDPTAAILNAGGKVGSDLEDLHRKHGCNVAVQVDLKWQDSIGSDYFRRAESEIYWDGEKEMLKPWVYRDSP